MHTDHLGAPQVMTDQSQKIVWQADYQPFGQTTMLTEDVTNNLRFLGQYYDAETDSNYNYFRNYESSIGRYIQSDLIGLMGGNNIYLYANANPSKFIDIYGLAPGNILKGLIDALTKTFSDLGGSIGGSVAGDTSGNSLGKKCSKYFCGIHVINPPDPNIQTECLMLDTAGTFDIGYDTVGSCVEDCKKRTHSKEFREKCLSKSSCSGDLTKPNDG